MQILVHVLEIPHKARKIPALEFTTDLWRYIPISFEDRFDLLWQK